MDWQDVIAKVTNAAPLVGSLFGPAGTIIGGGIKLLASALGVEPTQEAIMAEIASNPDALLKLKELEANNRIELEKLVLEKMRLEFDDTQSARDRETKIVQATGKKDYNLYILAWTIIGGYFGLTGMLLYFSYNGKPITDQTGALFMLLGTLSTAFGMVVGYFFGSSKSSADKNEQISKIRQSLGK